MEKSLSAKPRRLPTQCQICDGPALYSYVGAIVCPSCKMFFKRNAPHPEKRLVCLFDGDCPINRQARQLCSACRLKKCYANGMQKQLLRASTAKRGRKYSKGIESKKMPIQSRQLMSVNPLPTHQSTVLTNLIQVYDQCHQTTILKPFLDGQSGLPLKMRYKIEHVTAIAVSLASTGNILFEKNSDFLTLSSPIRSVLLQRTIKQVLACNSAFIAHQYQLFEDPICYEMMVTVYGQTIVDNGRLAGHRFDPDMTFIKLIVTILMFSPSDFTLSDDYQRPSIIKEILHIQNKYIELAWRYMIFKYDEQRAVKSFSNIVRALFALHASINGALEQAHYHQMIDTLVEQTEQSLIV